jgi:hypothetical protein
MALGSTQPLIKMSTRCISWGKVGRCVRLTTLPPSCTIVMKSGNLNFLEPSGPPQACNGTALPFTHLRLSRSWSISDTVLLVQRPANIGFCAIGKIKSNFSNSALMWPVKNQTPRFSRAGGPPYPRIQCPRLAAARKKLEKLKK